MVGWRGINGSRVARLAAGLAALALVAGIAAPAALAAPSPPVTRQAEMQAILDGLRDVNTAPGDSITFGDGHHDVTLSSGTSKVLSRRSIRSTDKVRVGSDTKTFVSAVVLQLVTGGRLLLDAPIDRYIPGVLRYPADKVPGDGAAYDGRTVTVRQLLQHTAGVPEYADLPYVLNPVHQIVPPTPYDLLAHALPLGPTFRPGSGWAYSNTDYTLIGLVVQARAGRSIRAEIAKRIVEPLGLKNTFFADHTHRDLPGDHVHGYLSSTAPLDVTAFEPSVWGTAGALVSSPDDMNTFLTALLAGKVLPPAMLAEMQKTVPYLTGGYGLGIVSVPLSCGLAWGHAGFLAGYQTFGLALPNGRHAFFTMNDTYAINLIPPTTTPSAYRLFELALC